MPIDQAELVGAVAFVPAHPTLSRLHDAARECRGCDLYRSATQTVFGVGPADARIVLVGEQPGDQEDRQGTPFVGPAGAVLDLALRDAGIDRSTAYVTNAVKHFKFTQSGPGTRRIHQKPDQREVIACRPWLFNELKLLEPELVVALGATAGQSLMGSAFRVTKERGTVLEWPRHGVFTGRFLATIHPSAVLRAPDREAAYAGLVADLSVAASALR